MRSIGDRGCDARLIVSEINVEERIGVPLLSASMRHSSITLYADALADADLSLIQAHTITWIAAVTAPDAE